MAHITTDDGVRLYYEETGSGTRSCSCTNSPAIIAATRRRCGFSRGAIAALPLMRAATRPPMCRRTGSNIRRSGRATTSATCSTGSGMAKAHIVGISMGGFATCISASPIPSAPVAGRRRLRLRREPGKRRSSTRRSRDRGGDRELRHGRGREDLRHWPDPRAIPEQGPARLGRVPGASRRAFDPRLGEHDARRAGAAGRRCGN